MTGVLPISALAWNWWAEFFLSMGLVTVVAVSFAMGLLFVDWLYLLAKRIESLPVPRNSYWLARWNLSRFLAITVGVLLAPFVSIAGYYLLAPLVWKLAPGMVESPEPDPDAVSMFENGAAMTTAVMISFAVAASVVLNLFFLLRRFGARANIHNTHTALFHRFARRYFQDNLLVGVLLMVLALPVAGYFFYNVALLLLVVSPTARHRLDQVILPNVDSLYLHSLVPLGAALPVVLLIPFLWLFIMRGGLLLSRYLKENIPMNLLFLRTIKLYALAFLGFTGYMTMGYWAQTCLKFIVAVIAK